MVGGYGLAGKGVKYWKTLSLPTHKRVTISMRAWAVDSWDNERFLVKADNKIVY